MDTLTRQQDTVLYINVLYTVYSRDGYIDAAAVHRMNLGKGSLRSLTLSFALTRIERSRGITVS